ncbi:MAG: transglutaminase-like domain-containing protein [Verrucomicrobiales bacterium]
MGRPRALVRRSARRSGGVPARDQGARRRVGGGANDPRAVAERLCRRVSQDVRYTALEFGIGAYQPRPASRAAATRYGDCKDKANLLRVLLAQQGIASRLVLLNTQHAGRVDLEIPVRQAFNHAILAVDLDGEAEPIYCDPTMKGASLGDIGPQDADRDVLLVDAAGKTEWRRTPPKGFGTIETEFDLAAEPGGLSGWVTVRFGGLMAVGMRERFAGQDRQQIRKFLSGSMIGPQFLPRRSTLS